VFFSVDCALGYYSVDKRQCIACGAGFYLSTGNRDGCDACPVGTNSQKTGLTIYFFLPICQFFPPIEIISENTGVLVPSSFPEILLRQ
jgi:hypothetical protein